MLIRFGKNGAFIGCSNYQVQKLVNLNATSVAAFTKAAADVGDCPSVVPSCSAQGVCVVAALHILHVATKPFSREERCPAEGCTGHLVETVQAR